MRRLALSAALLAALPMVGHADPITAPPRAEWYANNDGYWHDGTQVRVDESCVDLPAEQRASCSLEAFKDRPFVVIALVDTGINPYHHDFRAPEFVHDPAEYVTGYPAGTPTIEPSFDVADADGYVAARFTDIALWGEVPQRELRWIPETRIIGAITFGQGGAQSNGGIPAQPIVDDDGHGTGVASVSAGRWYGSNPHALIVVVEGFGLDGVTWAASQPWIDVVSNSWSSIAQAPVDGSGETTRPATERGQSIVFSAGNGLTNTKTRDWLPLGPVPDPCDCRTPDANPNSLSPYKGAPWVLTVGAASPINGQEYWWHSIPADVSSFGEHWLAASRDGVTREDNRDFGGTSNAAPTTAGVLSRLIWYARLWMGDTDEGQRPGGVIATGHATAAGPLADGRLTRVEAERVLIRTAYPVPFDPAKASWDYAIRPTNPLSYTTLGYGVVDRASAGRALRVLLGDSPEPARPDEDTFMAARDAVAHEIWTRL